MTPPASAVLAPVPALPPVQVLDFVEPLPGFPGYRDYALVTADPSGLVFWLQSVAPEGPRFLVVPAQPYFPDYAPALPAGVRARLGPAGGPDAQLYCLVTVRDGDVGTATANLRAPVVVDPATGRACQVVLNDEGLSMRRPLRR